MKNTYRITIKKIKKIFSFAFLALTVFMVSCEIPTDPTGIIELRLDTNVFTHKGFIAITDLADQDNLAGTALTAKVITDDSRPNFLVTEGGFFKDTWDINDGIAAFAVNPSYRGFTEPITFNLEISGKDYLTKNLEITISPADSITEIRATFLNIKEVPSGVAVAQQTAALASGGSNTAAITVATEASSTNTAAEIVVPADNSFLDANESKITSGDLTAQVVYFDGNDEEASRSSINGNAKSIVDENGDTLTNAIIKPVATADINMFVGATEVKKFEKEITVSMDISATYINPKTGQAVKAGDEFSIYSTSDNGNWVFENKAAVISRNGKLVVDLQTDHLSTFTIGAVVTLCNSKKAYINLGSKGAYFEASYEAVFKDAQGNKLAEGTAVKKTVSGETFLEINNAPSVQATLTLNGTGTSMTTDLIDWCSGNANVSQGTLDQAIPDGDTVELNISAKCSGSSSIVPNQVRMKIEYVSGSGEYSDVGLIKDGKISIPGVTLNKQYNLQLFYDGNSGKGTYTFNKTVMDILNYPLPGNVCAELGL
ncbi:hypothetical protein BTO04_04530 [Polaribacter sp. SA4-10]|uniref:hypothetical protein n=1 Tax=Polaribacter sp. SA4-10 TaxID=754397 RepID=UPI000B3D4291|nr:hypothetical protein [Polaribacter sp. SA4-10]ARV06011.1 hypothetical protein BTO04_04530 [Polaribacter sp. SA4-10]